MQGRHSADEIQEGPAEASYRGFPLRKVTWGYREQFRGLLDDLYAKGLLGDGHGPAELCGPLLEQLPQAGYDAVLREFLDALNSGASWIARTPRLLGQWRELGAELTAHRIYLGRSYFELWGGGQLPRDPAEAEFVIHWARQLLETDADLAFSFLAGYPELRRRLSAAEVPDFIRNGLTINSRNPATALDYFRLRIKSAEVYAEHLAHTCRLDRVRGRLERLFRAICGRSVQIGLLSELDSDELLERGSALISGSGYLFVPERVSMFPDRSLNRSWYLLATFMAAACQRFGSFSTVQGSAAPSLSHVLEALGAAEPRAGAALAQLIEVHRICARLVEHYPGAAGLLRTVARAEDRLAEPKSAHDELLSLAVGLGRPKAARESVRAIFERAARLAAA